MVAEDFLASDWMMVLVLLKMSNYEMVGVVENCFLCSVVEVEILHCYDLVVVEASVYLIWVVVVALESYSYLSDYLGLEMIRGNCYLVEVEGDKIFELTTEDWVEIENLVEDDFEVVEVLEIHQSPACDWLGVGEVHDWLEHYFRHQVPLFVVVVSIEIKSLHLRRHLVAEEILIELVVVALDYYCLALIHLLQLQPQLHFDHFFENLELF